MNARMWLRIGLALISIGLCGGCATSALWQQGRLNQWNEPASPPDLRLFLDTNRDDVLVQYNEFRERNDSVRRRAYYLHRNGDRIEQSRRPRFVDPRQSAGLSEIAFFESPDSRATLTNGEMRVRVATNGCDFTLVSRDGEAGRFSLPIYDDGSALPKRLVLMPWTLAADATIAGGFIAIYFWLPAGAPPFTEQTRWLWGHHR